MESGTAAMAMAEATPPRRCLPEEIVIWEILVRLPAKSLLRCRAVCCAWRRATSTRDFLLSHHGRQPTLPIVWGKPVSGFKYDDASACYDELLAFDHRAADAKLQSVARLDESYCSRASCNGLLILYKFSLTETSFSICNPVTREHAPLWIPGDFGSVLGMYLHRPSGEYRLLLHGRSHMPNATTGCYVFVLGSDQPLRYIGGPDAAGALRFDTSVLVYHSLHWCPMNESRMVILVFDTTTESFREMHAPPGPTKSSIFDSSIFEMDDKLGFCGYNDANEVLDIWVLQNYDGEVWVRQYNVTLPVEEILGMYGCWNDDSYGSVVSVDGDVLLLVSHGGWLFYVDTDGEVVDSFHRCGQQIYASDFRLKQTLIPHNFFTTLEAHAVNASPFL
ncbi:hypothetical protein QYE76_058894 [Lolium multiflorum]|uniref:F-box domain-containing protein n=1 Tax=Lolium multiflorum TaxID=4521 RepID=A0AAD8T7Y2_LOLMU|nr:hypothetical protein QYE76_058884 [Lolium multiflorum]KAK1670735.1 hypothetical protein QYE76_058894 [Lolium multiflorum]